MPDKYRYTTSDVLFNKNIDGLLIMMGPHCNKCSDYVDKTLSIYIRSSHKILGPNQLCRKCIAGISDEAFEKAWERQKNGKRIIYDADKIAKKEAKQVLESEMDIYRRVNTNEQNNCDVP